MGLSSGGSSVYADDSYTYTVGLARSIKTASGELKLQLTELPCEGGQEQLLFFFNLAMAIQPREGKAYVIWCAHSVIPAGVEGGAQEIDPEKAFEISQLGIEAENWSAWVQSIADSKR